MTSLHILVIENHPSSNRVLTELLEKHGHVVTQALTAREAIAAAAIQKHDLAIIDIRLPDEDGWRLLGILRGQSPNLRAIAVTGFGFAADMKKSEAAGFASHLNKPFELPTLLKEMERLFPAQPRSVNVLSESTNR